MRQRVDAIDLVRGLIMIVMALDHTRDFFGMPGDNPTDLSRASTALFLTRWITHFCAPVFFLLTGVGARLALERRTRGGLARYLATRGLVLIIAELTVVRVIAYQWNVDYRVTILVVLFALGCSMIVLAGLVYLPLRVVIALGLALVLGHDLADGVSSTNPVWLILHQPGFLVQTHERFVFVAYPLVPWIGVTGLGYALGATYRWDPARRRALLWRVGVVATVGFIVLRAINGYGDPRPWAGPRTVLAFLNTNKYPPSLAFLLMTLGPALLLLWTFDARTPRLLRPAVTFGRVPLFYFVLHFFLAHALAAIVCWISTGTVGGMFESPDLAHYPVSPPAGWGFSLPVVYALWIGIVLLAYVPCRWFADLKARRRDAWLSYL